MQNKLNREQRDDIAVLSAMKDSDIDLTDMPEVLDWSGAEIGRFFRKKKVGVQVPGGRKKKRVW